jgi:invasion protein IalB
MRPARRLDRGSHRTAGVLEPSLEVSAAPILFADRRRAQRALASGLRVCRGVGRRVDAQTQAASPPPAPPPKPAAAAAPAPAPVGSEPQSTTATFGDWVLRCQRTEVAGQPQRICEIAQTLEAQGQGVVAQVAFGRVTPKDPMRMTILLPANVSLPSTVRVGVDEKDEAPAELAWKRCLPGGCVAETEIKDEIVKRWRTQQPAQGVIHYAVASGQEVSVVFSFRGLAVALDNLAKTWAAQ